MIKGLQELKSFCELKETIESIMYGGGKTLKCQLVAMSHYAVDPLNCNLPTKPLTLHCKEAFKTRLRKLCSTQFLAEQGLY